MKKVIYIVKSELHIYPPCVTQIRLLNKAGVKVEVLFGSCNHVVTEIFEKEGIPYKELRDVRGKFKGGLDKLNNYYCFRKSLIKELKGRDITETVLWFGNAETLLSMKGALSSYTYAITFLELLDDHPFRMKLLKKLAQKSLFNISCEETRAYIMKGWWQLNKLPYIMPNKPYDNPSEMAKLSDKDAISILNEIGDKKIILYQGLIKDRAILGELVKAVNRLGEEYVLLLMGSDRENIIPELKKQSNKVFSGWVTAPRHLQVTAKAYLGIVYYDGMYCLNNAFCAPNKIYEYGAFGVPMLANNIPGLRNTVGCNGAAVCIDLTEDKIFEAINMIDANYEVMSRSSLEFYQKTDLHMIIDQVIKDNLL